MSLPIRKVGDELRVRDASGAIFKGVVADVRDEGTFGLQMPAGHRVGKASATAETRDRRWTFYRNETEDFGLTILGPWHDSTTLTPFNIIAAGHGKIVVDTGSSLEIYSKDS